jgi:hypothetical protein
VFSIYEYQKSTTMKKIIFILFLFYVFNSLQAQKNAVKVNPLGLAFGAVNGGYEFAVGDNQTVTISGVYYDFSGIYGFGVGAEQRFYFSSKEAFKGWHAGPSIGYASLQDNGDTASIFSFGGETGHQWVFENGFLIDLFGGLGFVVGGESLGNINSTVASVGLSIGYVW